jgi:hypothetical protein
MIGEAFLRAFAIQTEQMVSMYSIPNLKASSFTVTIAGVTIKVKAEQKVIISERFLPFLTENEPDFTADFVEVQTLTEPTEKCVFEQPSLAVYRGESGDFVRFFNDASNNKQNYAVGIYDFKNKYCKIEYLPQGKKFLAESGNCFFHLAWETMLLFEDSLILHASSVVTDKGAILFSGASGIGKSTQAQLWCDYEDAQLLNGDQTILNKANGVWIAHGSPYAGSSRCYVNDSAPIIAVVALEKSPFSFVRRLTEPQAFRKIYSGLTVNGWDAECVNKSCDITMDLISDVPVYNLSCTPDKEAVDTLKSILDKDLYNV